MPRSPARASGPGQKGMTNSPDNVEPPVITSPGYPHLSEPPYWPRQGEEARPRPSLQAANAARRHKQAASRAKPRRDDTSHRHPTKPPTQTTGPRREAEAPPPHHPTERKTGRAALARPHIDEDLGPPRAVTVTHQGPRKARITAHWPSNRARQTLGSTTRPFPAWRMSTISS
jgi:hypothetical protein